MLASPGHFEANARRIVDLMARAMIANQLLRHAPRALAEAYCTTRLASDHGRTLGTLPEGADIAGILSGAGPT
jgi:putative acyl-CoA dehydrogenase